VTDIRVLVVEDEPVAAAAHAAYVGRVDGFTLAGTAPDGQSALRMLTEFSAASSPVELVLLDMNLPDLHGLDIARRMRSAGHFADIIAITAVRELAIVRSAVSIGVVQYLIKPFTYATFADKLESYRQFREQLAKAWSTSLCDAAALAEPRQRRRRAMWTRPSPACGRRPSFRCRRVWPLQRSTPSATLSRNSPVPSRPPKS
jgi:response regulator of citrate/malate metabolism